MVDPTTLQALPIPNLTGERTTQKSITPTPIDLDGPQAQEPCVTIKDYGVAGINYYSHTQNPPYFEAMEGAKPEILLRRSVAAKLVEVNKALKPLGLEIFCFDGWRPQAVQVYGHDVWCTRWLMRTHPGMTQDEALIRADDYWSRGYESEEAVPVETPPPHSTGAAVDLTLRHIESKELVSMGSLFDEPTPLSYPDALESTNADTAELQNARAYRRLLYWTMHKYGFTCYPYEWWHYSFGDQEWAARTGAPRALYGKYMPHETT